MQIHSSNDSFAPKMKTNQKIYLCKRTWAYILYMYRCKGYNLRAAQMIELSRKVEQSGKCLYSSQYWELLAKEKALHLSTHVSVHSFLYTVCLKLQLLPLWQVPFITGYYHHYLPVFNWFVLWVHLSKPRTLQSFGCTTPHEGSLCCLYFFSSTLNDYEQWPLKICVTNMELVF